MGRTNVVRNRTGGRSQRGRNLSCKALQTAALQTAATQADPSRPNTLRRSETKALLDAHESDEGLDSESDSDDDDAGRTKDAVHFQPRALPVKKFDRDGFLVYAVFLATFMVSHIGNRSSDQ